MVYTSLQSLLDDFLEQRNFRKFARIIRQRDWVAETLHYSLSAEKPLQHRRYASWLLTHIGYPHKYLHPDDYLLMLQAILPNADPTLLRNWLAILKRSKLNADLEDLWFNQCMGIISTPDIAVSARVFALYASFPIIKKYRGLKREVQMSVPVDSSDYPPSLRVAMRKLGELKD